MASGHPDGLPIQIEIISPTTLNNSNRSKSQKYINLTVSLKLMHY